MHHHRPIRQFIAPIVLLLVGLFIASCSTSSGPSATAKEDSWLAEYNLDGLDGREITEQLDTMPVEDRPGDLIASVEPKELVLFDDQENEASIPLPAEEFYLSFAPYLEQTHDCHFHSLTTCLGEMRHQQIDVTVTDSDTDVVLFDESVRTYDNGFAGLWLPRDITATLTVTHGDRSASIPISTDAEAPTCITTLQLT
ncbi:CueP family metal-binding protein [Nesterenkonia alkaliphila]|nr:CueP family metal-binding protein [Nesterenkonia alkaliphila]GFZ93840.1 hypothetical protein GCM10011359_24130 [Nesterenkonia alkaliphila]